jgi:hypothetical protein
MLDLQHTIENLHKEYESKMKIALTSFDADLSGKKLEILNCRQECDDMQLALNAERTANELLIEEINQLRLKLNDMSFGANESLKVKQEFEVELEKLLNLYTEQGKEYEVELNFRKKEYEDSLNGLKCKVTELENKICLQAEAAAANQKTKTDNLLSQIKILEASLAESMDIQNALKADQSQLESYYEILRIKDKSKIESIEFENESLKTELVQALDSCSTYQNVLSQEKNDLEKQLMLCRTELALLEDVSATEITRVEEKLQKQVSRYSEDIIILQEDLAKLVSDRDTLKLEVKEKNAYLQVLEDITEEAYLTDKLERDRLQSKIHTLTAEIFKLNDSAENVSEHNGKVILVLYPTFFFEMPSHDQNICS